MHFIKGRHIFELNGNELPLRHLLSEWDGGQGTKGAYLQQPRSISASYKKVKPIETPVQKDSSRDPWLLYKYANATAAGLVDNY